MVDQMNVVFRWTIKNFHMCPHSIGERLESPQFILGSYKFLLRIHPRHDAEYTSVFLCRRGGGGEANVSVDYEMCIVNDSGLCENVRKSTNKQISKNDNWGFAKFIKRDCLLTEQREKLLPNDNLTIKCGVSLSSATEGKISVDSSRILMNMPSLRVLSQDLGLLLKNGIHSDMTIQAGKKKIKVHRAILECRCPQLMPHMTTFKGFRNEYYLRDIKFSELETLLQYIYSGTFGDCNMYNAMFVASNTFSLPDLRKALTSSYPSSISATTEINAFRTSFRWSITNFLSKTDPELVYPVFSYRPDGEDDIHVILIITRSKNRSENLELKFQKICADIAFIHLKISIFETKSSTAPVTVKEYEHEFKHKNWITPLGLDTRLTEIVFDNSLNMLFEISISNKKIVSEIEEVCVEPKAQESDVVLVKDLKLLQQDMEKLYSCQTSSDIILCVDGIKLPAHKAILCARSPVFAEMFEHDTVGKRKRVISMDDIESATISSMLKYIYTGCLDPMYHSKPILMYAAANKYELATLKQKCSILLKYSITADNVGDILMIADEYRDEYLKKGVYDYIASNPKQMLRSKQSLDILKSKVAAYADILNVLLDRISSLEEESN